MNPGRHERPVAGDIDPRLHEVRRIDHARFDVNEHQRVLSQPLGDAIADGQLRPRDGVAGAGAKRGARAPTWARLVDTGDRLGRGGGQLPCRGGRAAVPGRDVPD